MATTGRKTPARSTRSSARKPPARKPATRRTADAGPPSLSAAHVKGFAAGVVAGVLIGAGGVVWLSKAPSQPSMAAATPAASEEQSDSKPRFDFYTVLPNQNLDLTSDVEPAELRDSANKDLYVLQAGSFRSAQDADRRRGELALLGLEASIEKTASSNGHWYRVYIGPFESRSAMARARSITAQQSIDTLLLKRPRNP